MFCQATGHGKGAEVDFLCVSWTAQVGALPASVDDQLAALINSSCPLPAVQLGH